MPPQQIDFSKYEGQAPPQIDFSKYEEQAPAVPEESHFWRNLAMTVLKNHWGALKAMQGSPDIVDTQGDKEFKWSDVHPSWRNAVDGIASDLKDTFHAMTPDAGTTAGNLLTVAQGARPVSAATIANVAQAARGPVAAAADAASGILSNSIIGSFSPRARNIGEVLGKTADAIRPPHIDALSEAASQPTAPAPGNLTPSPLAAQSQAQIPAPQQPRSYPEGVQPRPTDRAEILDDKAVQERMRQDMGLQAYRNARIAGQERAPAPKWQLAAQAKADAVRAQAEAEAQQILADAEKAATTPAKFTKTVTPKAAAAGKAQPVAEDLSSPNRLIDLMQQSIDALNARKGK